MTFASARRLLFASLVILYAAMAMILATSKISLEPRQALATAGTLLFCIALAAYARWRKMHRLTAFFDTFVACLMSIIPLTVLSYFAMSLNMPMADNWLMSADAALGFDWKSVVTEIDRWPVLAMSLNVAYQTFAYQLLILPLYLSLAGKGTEAVALIFGFILFCALLSVVAVFFPALGAFAYLGTDPSSFVNLDPHYGTFFLPEFHAIRNDPEFTLRLQESAGILTFPSGHAGTALLLAWIGWRSKLLRVPLLVLNIAMGFSAITNGGHYLVDVLAGLALAGLVIAMLQLALFRQSQTNIAMAGHQPA